MGFNRPCMGCGTLTRNGNRCQQCNRQFEKRQYSGLKKPYGNKEWRKLSAEVRAERPWCEICGRTDGLTVDHLDTIASGGALLAPKHRLRVLCRSCHGRVTKHPKGGRAKSLVIPSGTNPAPSPSRKQSG